MKCSDTERVTYATYMLQGSAHDWQKMEKRRVEQDQEPYTCHKFKDAFFDKYFPKSVPLQTEREFIRLTQGAKTLNQYETEFERLAKFAPRLVEIEDDCARRFKDSLRPWIKQGVVPFKLQIYGAVVSIALLVKQGLNEVQKERDSDQ